MPYFNIVATTNDSTVVTAYEPAERRAEAYQSEAELEKEIKERFSQNKWIFEIHFDITDDEEIERGEI